MTQTDKEKIAEAVRILTEVLEEHLERMEKRVPDNAMWMVEKVFEASKVLTSGNPQENDEDE